jgi:hypothetical protein
MVAMTALIVVSAVATNTTRLRMMPMMLMSKIWWTRQWRIQSLRRTMLGVPTRK